jgi:hypothetical protein
MLKLLDGARGRNGFPQFEFCAFCGHPARGLVWAHFSFLTV